MIVDRLRHSLLLILVVAGSRSASGQAEAPAVWGLFSVRYDTFTSDFIYAAYGYGDSFAMVGVLHNPRSDYSEVLGGLGRNIAVADQVHSVAVAVSRATEGWYAQLYCLPSLQVGRLRMRASSQLNVPLEPSSTLQFALSPLSTTLALPHGVEIGVGSDLYASKGRMSTVAIGPEIRFSIPKAVLGGDMQRLLASSSTRFRLFFLSAF